MSNVAGKAYGMNVVTPLRPSTTWLNRLLFMTSRAFPGTLSGLLGLSLIHFARWVIIRRDQWPQRGQPKQTLTNDYVLFCSNFNGTWDQYIDAFADGIPSGLDLLWYCSTKYPKSIPITPFKDYIRANQVDTSYYYNATPGSAQRDIKLALSLAASLRAVGEVGDDAAFGVAYEHVLLQVQGQMGSAGYAPIASCDTSAADDHRSTFVWERWGPHAKRRPQRHHRLEGLRAAPPEMGTQSEQSAVRSAVSHLVKSPPRPDDMSPVPVETGSPEKHHA